MTDPVHASTVSDLDAAIDDRISFIEQTYRDMYGDEAEVPDELYADTTEAHGLCTDAEGRVTYLMSLIDEVRSHVEDIVGAPRVTESDAATVQAFGDWATHVGIVADRGGTPPEPYDCDLTLNSDADSRSLQNAATAIIATYQAAAQAIALANAILSKDN
jgi:hypothetical protein